MFGERGAESDGQRQSGRGRRKCKRIADSGSEKVVESFGW